MTGCGHPWPPLAGRRPLPITSVTVLRFLPCLLALLAAAAPAQNSKPISGYVRIRLVTSAGPIVVALDARHAPKTTANFLAYVDDGRLDGTTFYRSARAKGDQRHGFIQGGIGQNARRMLGPVPLESTVVTGIHHTDGAISMARSDTPSSATANFSILVGAAPGMDGHHKNTGFAAFGHVVAGMDTVRRILALPTGGGSGPMLGQMILKPVRLIHAQRLDGTPHPTGMPKPWLLNLPG